MMKGVPDMADDKPLKPADFPLRVEKENIVTGDGQPIAEVCDKKTAEDLAERLNQNENQREEDRWSA
jgi:hypothetical protein